MRISLVIPAWNESKYLPRLLDSVDEARAAYAGGAEAVEVIVADNDSTDDTAAIAEGRGCRVAHVERRRIACARNGGAAVASGEILCFCDADFRVHRETFNFIDTVMRDGGYVGGGTGLVAERWSPGIVVTYYAFLLPLMAMRMDGGVWFCRRVDFEHLGGYDESLPCTEDVRFLMTLRRHGRSQRPRQRLANRRAARRLGVPAAVSLGSARKFDTHGDWHMLTDLAKGLWWLVFSPKRLGKHIQQYWYEDER